MNRKAFTLIELLVVVAIIGILAAVGVVAYNGYTSSAKKAVVKQNHKAVVKWIQADAMKCVINGGTIFRQTNNSGGGQNKDCSNVTDYNKTPFHENVLQTHIGYQGMVKNPYGSVGKDRTCDIWSGWTDMTSIQSAHLNKKMCKGQIGLYSLTVEKNGCDREMVVQSGLTDEYWTFSSTGSDKVLSTIVCITHRWKQKPLP